MQSCSLFKYRFSLDYLSLLQVVCAPPCIYSKRKYEIGDLACSELWPEAATEFVIRGFTQLLWPSVYIVTKVVSFEKPKMGIHLIIVYTFFKNLFKMERNEV